MEEDQEKRSEFINVNIIEPGLDLEAITEIATTKGKSFDTLNIEELKVLIKEFNESKNKPEEVKVEEQKQEPPKQEEVKVEEQPKQEEVKVEEPKKEEVKVEEQKKEEVKVEEPKKEEVKVEEPKKEEVKVEEPKKEEVKVEEPKKEEVKGEEQKKEEVKVEEQKQEQPKQEENKDNQNQKQEEPKTKKKQESENKNKPKASQQNEASKKSVRRSLYYPESYQFNTIAQQNNKLLELVKNKTPINVQISDPKIAKEGTRIIKPIYSYRVQCKELKSDVRRTYADFEWLKAQLNIRYPLRLVPVIVKDLIVKQAGKNLMNENDENFELRKIRYLNRFIESILKKKILCGSPIFYEFLVLDTIKFAKYKSILDKKAYNLETNLSNLITTKGEVKCKLEKTTVNDTEYLYPKAYCMSDIYEKICTTIDETLVDFNKLYQHLRTIGALFKSLTQAIDKYKFKNKEEIQGSINGFKDTFEKWSVNVYDQCLYLNANIRENLNYMSNELEEFSNSFKRYRDFRYEYEEFTEMINKEKGNLIDAHIDIELKKEENKDKKRSEIKYNQKGLDEVFKDKNMLLSEEKKRLSTAMNYMIKDYEKLFLTHAKKLKELNENAKKTMIIDFIQG